jgi:nudix-type nucleoside diphosphatase (YffH/AdpP family)
MTRADAPALLSTETVFDGWLKVRRITYRGRGGEIVRREIAHHGSAAAVLPYDPERRTVLLVRLPRTPMIAAGAGLSLEAPAGLIEDGEAPEACVRREALEEVGVRLGALERVAQVWPMPGVSTEQQTLFLAPYATADRVEAGGGVTSESEDIEVVEASLAELAAAADSGGLADGKTLILLLTLRLRRPQLFAAP